MNFKLFYEAKSNKPEWMEWFSPLKGSRVLGSIEQQEPADVDNICKQLHDKGYQTSVVKTTDNARNIVFYKQLTPMITRGIKLYAKYGLGHNIWTKTKAQGLTKEEHIFLGKLFGFHPDEIQNLLDDLWPDNTEEEGELQDATNKPLRIGYYRLHFTHKPDNVYYWDGKTIKNLTTGESGGPEILANYMTSESSRKKKYVSKLWPVNSKKDFIPHKVRLTSGGYEDFAEDYIKLDSSDIWGDKNRAAGINPFKLKPRW